MRKSGVGVICIIIVIIAVTAIESDATDVNPDAQIRVTNVVAPNIVHLDCGDAQGGPYDTQQAFTLAKDNTVLIPVASIFSTPSTRYCVSYATATKDPAFGKSDPTPEFALTLIPVPKNTLPTPILEILQKGSK